MYFNIYARFYDGSVTYLSILAPYPSSPSPSSPPSHLPLPLLPPFLSPCIDVSALGTVKFLNLYVSIYVCIYIYYIYVYNLYNYMNILCIYVFMVI